MIEVVRYLSPSALMLACVVSPAAADDVAITPTRPLTMSDPSGLSFVGLDTQWTWWSTPAGAVTPIDFIGVTFDLAADIAVARHWMLLARMPVSRVSQSTECCDLAAGNLTVGGRGLWPTILDNRTRAVAGAELTASLPTATDEGLGRSSSDQAAFSQLPHDPGRYAPDHSTLRVTSFAQIYSRRLLLQAELGMQIYAFDDADEDGDRLDIGYRLAVAGGIRATSDLTILLELDAMIRSYRFVDDDDTFVSLDLGARYTIGRLALGLRGYAPLDMVLRDRGMLGIGFELGSRF